MSSCVNSTSIGLTSIRLEPARFLYDPSGTCSVPEAHSQRTQSTSFHWRQRESPCCFANQFFQCSKCQKSHDAGSGSRCNKCLNDLRHRWQGAALHQHAQCLSDCIMRPRFLSPCATIFAKRECTGHASTFDLDQPSMHAPECILLSSFQGLFDTYSDAGLRLFACWISWSFVTCQNPWSKTSSSSSSNPQP